MFYVLISERSNNSFPFRSIHNGNSRASFGNWTKSYWNSNVNCTAPHPEIACWIPPIETYLTRKYSTQRSNQNWIASSFSSFSHSFGSGNGRIENNRSNLGWNGCLFLFSEWNYNFSDNDQRWNLNLNLGLKLKPNKRERKFTDHKNKQKKVTTTTF